MRMSVSFVPFLFAALFLGSAEWARAQDRLPLEQAVPRVKPGDRVKITLLEGKPFVRMSEGGGAPIGPEGGRQVIGSVKTLEADQVVLQDQRYGGDWLIPLSSVERTELSLGMRGNGDRGFPIGLALGLTAGLLNVLTYDEEDDGGWGSGDGLGREVRPGGGTVLLSTIFGGLVGAGVGALLRTEHWEDAALSVRGLAPPSGPWARFGLNVRIPAGGCRSPCGGPR